MPKLPVAASRPIDVPAVADRQVRVTQYQLPSFELQQQHTPQLGIIEAGYRYGMVPLYLLFPKPGELDKTIQYLLSGQETGRRQDDLMAARQEMDPWTPVWSSALFLFVVLGIACIYVEWQDF